MKIETEVEIVKMLGEEMGYGHLMDMASALWRKSLRDAGNPESGAFVPTIHSFIKDEFQDMRSIKIYNALVNNALK